MAWPRQPADPGLPNRWLPSPTPVRSPGTLLPRPREQLGRAGGCSRTGNPGCHPGRGDVAPRRPASVPLWGWITLSPQGLQGDVSELLQASSRTRRGQPQPSPGASAAPGQGIARGPLRPTPTPVAARQDPGEGLWQGQHCLVSWQVSSPALSFPCHKKFAESSGKIAWSGTD